MHERLGEHRHPLDASIAWPAAPESRRWIRVRVERVLETDVIVGFRWPYQVGPDTEPLAGKLAKLRRYADDVIAKVR